MGNLVAGGKASFTKPVIRTSPVPTSYGFSRAIEWRSRKSQDPKKDNRIDYREQTENAFSLKIQVWGRGRTQNGKQEICVFFPFKKRSSDDGVI